MRREQGSSPTDIGTPGAELVGGLEGPGDIVVPRLHGMTPFTSTSLDQILRNLGVRTVVATGVSVNLGVFGMALTALDLGYQVIERNWRCREGELDLVLERGRVVVFCEVKTRRSDRFGAPVEAITHKKRRRLRVLAAKWLDERQAADDLLFEQPRA